MEYTVVGIRKIIDIKTFFYFHQILMSTFLVRKIVIKDENINNIKVTLK